MLSQIFWAAHHRKEIKKVMKGEAIIMNGPLNYNQDGLATQHNADFMQEPAFRQAYDGTWGKGLEPIHWRAYTQCWAARHGLNLEGDFVECGVERGRSAKMVMDYLEFENSPKRYWLLDTFCGLDDAQVSPAERERGIIEFSRERYYDSYDEVCELFADYTNVETAKGVQ